MAGAIASPHALPAPLLECVRRGRVCVPPTDVPGGPGAPCRSRTHHLSREARLNSNDLCARIARDFQAVDLPGTDAPLVAAAVTANNARIAEGARAMLRMEDHPGTFDPWCRAFVIPEAR